MNNAPYPPGNPQILVNQPTNAAPGKGLAITSLVLGIVGIIVGFCPFTFYLGYLLAILAIVFGIIGRKHGFGIAGLILGCVALIASIIMTFVMALAAAAAEEANEEFLRQFEREMESYESSSYNW